MTPREFIRRTTGAFFVWPKSLLDAELNRPMLANTVKHDLFDNNARGWNAYVEERRREVEWFADDLPEAAKNAAPAHVSVSNEAKQSTRYSTWLWPDKSA